MPDAILERKPTGIRKRAMPSGMGKSGGPTHVGQRFAELLKQLEAEGKTQEELASAWRTKQTTLSKIAAGKRQPAATTMDAVVLKGHIPPAFFWGELGTHYRDFVGRAALSPSDLEALLEFLGSGDGGRLDRATCLALLEWAAGSGKIGKLQPSDYAGALHAMRMPRVPADMPPNPSVPGSPGSGLRDLRRPGRRRPK